MAMTIIDIANLSGLSKSTVSRYLNNGSVSKKAAAKIQAVIDEHGFQTNVFASRLKSNKSNLIGLLIPSVASLGTMKILKGLSQKLSQYHYHLLTFFEEEQGRSLDYLKQLQQQGVDGLIYINDHPKSYLENFESVTATPFLHIGHEKATTHSYLETNYACGQLLGQHVSELDGKRVIYISLPTESSQGARERRDGFLDSLSNSKKIVHSITCSYSSKAAYDSAEEFMKLKPDIIACASDTFVLGILNYCNENQISIPHDLKIASIGNYDFTQEFALSITSIELDYTKIGEQIASEMLNKLEEITVSDSESINLKLHIRNSSAFKI